MIHRVPIQMQMTRESCHHVSAKIVAQLAMEALIHVLAPGSSHVDVVPLNSQQFPLPTFHSEDIDAWNVTAEQICVLRQTFNPPHASTHCSGV